MKIKLVLWIGVAMAGLSGVVGIVFMIYSQDIWVWLVLGAFIMLGAINILVYVLRCKR